jgi:Ca2+-binding RTX toxin-like protein
MLGDDFGNRLAGNGGNDLIDGGGGNDLLSDEHFSVDGTLIKAWASMKSFQPKPDAGPPDTEGPGDAPPPAAAADSPPEDATPSGQARCPAPAARTATPRSTSGEREAFERDACLDHRSGRPALQEIARHEPLGASRRRRLVVRDPVRRHEFARKRLARDHEDCTRLQDIRPNAPAQISR